MDPRFYLPASCRRSVCLIACVASLCLAAMSSHAAPLPEIVVGEGFDTPTTMPGAGSRTVTTDDVAMQVVESLVAVRSDGSIAPMVADSWTISPDGKIYTFTLRHGISFQNGAPVTSAEVKWSFEHMIDPKGGVRCKSVFDGTAGPKIDVTTPSADTVVFTLSRPYAVLLQQMTNPQCPFAILHPSSVDAQGKWVKPVATGPYMIGDWKHNEYMVLNKFEGYKPRAEKPDGNAGAKVAYANIRYVIIPDTAAQKSALMSGQIDIVLGDSENLPPKDPRWSVYSGPGLNTANLLLQTRDPLLSDVRIRKAIALALDLSNMVKAASNGYSKYNASFVPEVSPYYDAVQKTGYSKDIEQAKALLTQAGYKGQPITIITNQRYPYMYHQAVIAQQLLERVGIHCQLQLLEWVTQEDKFRSGNFQMMSFGYSARTDPALMYGDVIGNKQTTPMAQWDSPEAQKVLDSIAGVSDPKLRQAAFDKLHQMMLADVPTIVTYDIALTTIVSSKIHGFSDWPIHRMRLFNLQKY
jgi:peptide/nickel transport system substrate-binding protein